MYIEKQFGFYCKVLQKPSALILFVAIILVGCGGASEESNNTGNLRFYNISPNAPAIYLTIDEDLSDDDEDAFEMTYSGINFTGISSYINIDVGDYYYEIAFQNEDSTHREDLALILNGSVHIEQDSTQLMVLNDDINSPKLTIFNIPVIDDDDDDENNLFNLRILNMHPSDAIANIYWSKDDQSFNEAQLIGQFNHGELSDNQKIEQGSYIFYIVDPITNEVVYQSDGIDFSYSIQYIMVIRENTAVSSSPYLLDKISTATVVENLDVNTESHIRAYNAIKKHDLLPDYQGSIELNLVSIDAAATTESFAFGEFSQTLYQENGDYSIDVHIPTTDINLLSHHLLTLPKNSDKTVFFYLDEHYVDDDNDGDVDENNDGIVDEIEVNINSLVVENSNEESIYDHKLTLINLVDSDDFDAVQFFFVRSNELIDSTPFKPYAPFAQPAYISLLNNTYKVYAVAKDNSSEIILDSFELVLNDASKALFLIIQDDATAPSGYRVKIADQ